MTPFPLLSRKDLSERLGRRSESYAFQVGDKHFTLQFWPMTYLEGYSEHQLTALEASDAYEVSFRLEDYTLPDGTILAGYDLMNTGNAFQILGGVANGILDWSQQRRPEYLYFFAHGTRRQRLYDKMILSFAARGSRWHRLAVDPFAGLPCQPEVFWLGHNSDIVAADQHSHSIFKIMLDSTHYPEHAPTFYRQSREDSTSAFGDSA